MTAEMLIKLLLKGNNFKEVFIDISVWHDTYRSYAKLIHPDVCKLADAEKAYKQLEAYKNFADKGIVFKDDAGEARYFPDRIEFNGDIELLKLSLANYKTLITLKDDWSVKMRIFLPKCGEIKDNKLVFMLWEYGVPILALDIQPHDHVNWITNRMFAFVDWLCSVGYVHNGINPTSAIVLPEMHGLNICSFYHLKKIETKLDTVSGPYLSFYPANIFTKKLAEPSTDIALIKKTAIWLLGDKSGIGIKLKKTHNIEIINFLTRVDIDPCKAVDDHKELIKKLFERRFIVLTI